MVLTNITNKRKMAERQRDTPPESSLGDLSPIDLNMPLAKRLQLKREKQDSEAVTSDDKTASGETKKSGAKGDAFKSESFTPFVVFEDHNVESKASSGDGDSSAQEEETVAEQTIRTPDVSYTSIKNKGSGRLAESDIIAQPPSDVEPVVCVFSRKKSPKESTSSTSPNSDDSTKCPDDNHNTVLRKKKKSRRAAIGFPSETTKGDNTEESVQQTVEGTDGCADIETAIEKLPSPDELPSRMSADQIADIDKLFDSLVPDFTAPPVTSEPETKEASKPNDPSHTTSERRRSTRRTSFILPCHRNQPDVPLLEQTDDNTPIHDKKFHLPSSGDDSFTPSSVTPVVVQAATINEGIGQEKKGFAKRRRPTKKAGKSRTKKRVQRLESGGNDKGVETSTDSAAKCDLNPVQPDDITFASPVVQVVRPSQAKRRRRSADIDIVSAQQVLRTPSPDTLLEDLPKITARRSNRIKRRSIEIFRIQLRKEAGEESPNTSSDGQDTPESAASTQKIAVLKTDNLQIDHSQTPNKSIDAEDFEIPGQNSVPSTPDSANVSLNVSIGESPVATPSGSNKSKTRRGKRKREPSVEDIYHNKLWRTQMPKEKNWETIFEEPKCKKGQKEYQSSKKFKRYCNFDEFYNQIRLKRRRQKALKRGWKPLTKKKEEKAGKRVEEKLLTLDQEMIEEEMPDTSISETLALLGEPLVSLPRECQTIVTASPTKSGIAHSAVASKNTKSDVPKHVVKDVLSIETESIAQAPVSIIIEEAMETSARTESTKSSQSDSEFFTPNASLLRTNTSSKEFGKEQSQLSAIGEEEDDAFYTPAANPNQDHDSVSSVVDTTLKEHACTTKSPESSDRSSDSLSLTKTPVRPEEVADMSGVYSLSP